MMTFWANTAFALLLLALASGFLVLVKAKKQDEPVVKSIGVFLGYAIMVLSIVGILCTTYYSFRYWEDGYYKRPLGARGWHQEECRPYMMKHMGPGGMQDTMGPMHRARHGKGMMKPMPPGSNSQDNMNDSDD